MMLHFLDRKSNIERQHPPRMLLCNFSIIYVYIYIYIYICTYTHIQIGYKNIWYTSHFTVIAQAFVHQCLTSSALAQLRRSVLVRANGAARGAFASDDCAGARDEIWRHLGYFTGYLTGNYEPQWDDHG